MAVLAALALPGLGAFSSRKTLSRQADRIAVLLYRARDLAMEEGFPWRVQFDPGKGTWVCFGDENSDSVMDAHERRIGPEGLEAGVAFGSRARPGPNKSNVPEDGISLVDNRVSFSPLGSCNSGTIYLCSEERSMAVRVLPASGVVRVWEFRDDWEVIR